MDLSERAGSREVIYLLWEIFSDYLLLRVPLSSPLGDLLILSLKA